MNFNEEFKNKVPYPERIKKPYLKRDATADECREHADNLEKYEKEIIEYKKQMKLYREGASEAQNRFVKWVDDDLGLNELPEWQQKKLWQYAYQQGHSSGLQEIYGIMCDIIELVRE